MRRRPDPSASCPGTHELARLSNNSHHLREKPGQGGDENKREWTLCGNFPDAEERYTDTDLCPHKTLNFHEKCEIQVH